MKHLIMGGGAAGIFCAISCAAHHPTHQVILLEKTRQLLAKVRISGGGRCNVTHACFDPRELVKHYPRGNRELLGPFTRFQPADTIRWFESRGVPLKIEEDGRMFPTTDSSQTIIDCLLTEAERLGVTILVEHGVQNLSKLATGGFSLELSNGNFIEGDRLVMTTGSAPKIYPLLEKLGHRIIPLVPSLFTFNIPRSPFNDLAGISVKQAKIYLPEIKQEQTGPLLITHWGLSGPAVLKTSAWAARELHACDYQTPVLINWLPNHTPDFLRQQLMTCKTNMGARRLNSESFMDLPKQLWKCLLSLSGVVDEQRWASLSQNNLQNILRQLTATELRIEGKTIYKQEFVTCGGVALEEVNFKTMESKKCEHLYFAGEILNIDGVTGGFNFQNAWTTGWIAGAQDVKT